VLFSITGHHRGTDLLRFVFESISRPRGVTGKMPLKNYKIKYKAQKKKFGPIHQLKTTKTAMNSD